nr:thioesterase family protein [Aestuariicella hydrocarbonica]
MPHRIRFSECDPAGIVFYPKYFEMFNSLLEAWIDSLLDGGFAAYILDHRFGLPSVKLDVEFLFVSRMGDDVLLDLQVVKVGRSSLTLALSCIGNDDIVRVRATQIVVATSLETHRSIPVPKALRDALNVNGVFSEKE